MGRGNSKAGKTSGGGNKVSPLQAFRSNARQFNEALAEGRRRHAAVVEYTDLNGRKSRRYWNGATYTERKSSLYTRGTGKYSVSGTYSSKYHED